ncbi:MAG: hypothetical protein IPI01_20785 [Ignavibacteriae bacterium]|nr:hypothetical protein [Ignavibacteriota bacterium]
MKILIAEDDAVSKLVLMTKLQSMKFHVIAANDGGKDGNSTARNTRMSSSPIG